MDAHGLPAQPSIWPSGRKYLENGAGSGHALDFGCPAEYGIVIPKSHPAHALMDDH